MPLNAGPKQILEVHLPVVPKVYPQQWTVDLREREYQFYIAWNDEGNFFELSILNLETDRYICQGRKLVYGRNVLLNVTAREFHDVRIVPFDYALAYFYQGLTQENFGEDVFLWIDGV